MGTGWFAADAANVMPGSMVAVGGDGAVRPAGNYVRQADGSRTRNRDERHHGRESWRQRER